MNILFGTFLAVTFMPAVLLAAVALLGGDRRIVHRVARMRAPPRNPRRPHWDAF